MRRVFVKSAGGGWQRYEPQRLRVYGFAGRAVVQANNSVPLKGFFLVHLAAAVGAAFRLRSMTCGAFWPALFCGLAGGRRGGAMKITRVDASPTAFSLVLHQKKFFCDAQDLFEAQSLRLFSSLSAPPDAVVGV